ncbi:MAG: hypothetical protein JWM19_1079 [Actinomycetia bacterium]|nr:hypothetical protein [Actinomycetes bacterium]
MNFPSLNSKRRVASLAGACALALGGLASATVAGAGPADAAAPPVLCETTEGTPCTLAGSAGVTGVLNMSMYTSTLTWSNVAPGTSSPDTVPADLGFTVDDESMTGNGWNVNAYYDGFTNTVTHTAAAITLKVNGSTTTDVTGTVPGNTLLCTPPTDCSAPTPTLTYPVTIGTSSATPLVIYNANTGSGEGPVDIGIVNPTTESGEAPVAWWVDVPGTRVPAGLYTTTVTVAIDSGPTAP